MSGMITKTGRKRSCTIMKIPITDIFINDKEDYFHNNPAIIKQMSIDFAENGIENPVFVKKTDCGYILKSGEEIFFAAKMAEIEFIPCIIIDEDTEDAGMISQIKDIHNHGYDFFKEAEAIEKLISCYGMTQEDAAAHLGKAQSTVANKLRLLRLTEEERTIITEHHLTERHARALLRLASSQERMCILNMVIQYGFNVEKTELAVDKVIGSRRPKEVYKKRKRTSHSVKSYVRTLMKAIEGLESTGVDVDTVECEYDKYFELRLRIPNSLNMKSSSIEKYFTGKHI